MKLLHDVLEDAYLDYFNNYLSVEAYADHNHIEVSIARLLLDIGRHIHQQKHPS